MSLIRVARNPILKFSKSERFQAPFHILLKENLNIETFQEVFHLLQSFIMKMLMDLGSLKNYLKMDWKNSFLRIGKLIVIWNFIQVS